MKLDLEGKVVIVTGGGGAIGSAMCKRFAENGAKVVVSGRTLSKLEAVVEEIRAGGGEASAITADVSNRESDEALVAKTVEIYGRLDCLVNNAGINGGPDKRVPIHEYDDDLWERIIQTDLNGVYYCSKPAIKQMIAQGEGGSIINIGSIVGLTPLRLQCAFTAAKAGVFNLTKAMAMELAPENIRVNGIAPGSIMFEGTRALFYSDKARSEGILSHIPQHRAGDPDDIAYMTCFLADEKVSGYMTGSIVTIDGGWICGYTRDF